MIFYLLAILTLIIGLGAMCFGVFVADEELDAFDGFTIFIISAIVAMLFMLLALVTSYVVPHNFTTKNLPLAALQDGDHISGNFFLGIGSIDDTQKYSFYIADKGGYKLDNEDADHVIVYQDQKPGHAYAVKQTACYSHVSWLVDCGTDGRIEAFHVPVGSIKSGFVLDAK